MKRSAAHTVRTRLHALYAPAFCWATLTAHDALAAESAHHGTDEAGDHGAAAAGHAESSAGLPQLDATTFPSQLFWLLVTFVVLYMVFKSKTLPEISGVLENRRDHINSDLETAEKLRREAEEVRQTHESGLEKARAESTKILADMQAKLKAKADKSSSEFQETATKEIDAM